MGRILLMLVFFLSCAFGSYAAEDDRVKSPQVIYIEQFATLAVEEMYRSGVPASITLAQGLLESGAGRSELAVRANNHFGIKCHNSWEGGRVYHDDDRKGECFRSYPSPEESFRDHSDFLRYRDRYKFLFELERGDYKGWAHGLRKAGYATDRSYPDKLIKLIEDYRLNEYDRKSLEWAYEPKGEVYDRNEAERRRQEKKMKRASRKAERKTAKEQQTTTHTSSPVAIPASPLSIEQAQPLDDMQREEFSFVISRRMYSLNGVPFVYSVEGETYESIAETYHLFKKEILRFNDLEADAPLAPGTVVYVQAKKRQAVKGVEKYVMEGDETMRDIAQRYAVKLSQLYKMNSLPEDYVPKQGDVIKLRRK